MSDTPFEMRAGVRVFITAPRDDLPYAVGDDGLLYDRHFKATLVSQHTRDRWYAETDAGDRLLVSKADVIPLDEHRADDGLWFLAVGILAALLSVVWFY